MRVLTPTAVLCAAFVWVSAMGAASRPGPQADVPSMGRDTVLVWSLESGDGPAQDFVVRIASFLPDRFVEWENTTTQGTVLMTEKAVSEARTFLNTRLFEAGTDTRSKNATTLWLSRRIFRELKSKGRSKVALDAVDTWMTVEGEERMGVLVNRSLQQIPILKVADERGAERWFCDSEENPLLVKHLFRHFSQTLTSITTDKPNTLRWIKGAKLPPP